MADNNYKTTSPVTMDERRGIQQIVPLEKNSLLEGLNREQLAAVKHTNGPLLIVAGAGTGKTTVITKRIAYLVEQGLATPDEIVALTFTEKAAGEMAERVDLLMPLGHYDQWICTFHGFCERVLKSHALDIGLPNDFKILNETAAWILVHKNLENFNLNYYKPLGNPNKFIDSLLSHFSRCKDEVITPEEYLEYGQELRLQMDNPEKIKGQGLRAKKTSATPLSPTPSALSPEVDTAEIARIEELAGAFHTYQKLLVDNNYLDFGDLINYTLELFKKRPKILKFYQNKFKFLMVDEFQDTNYAQYELVRLLSADKKNLVVVGDDDQSIYKFRGASVSNILKLKQNFPELKEITLIENYRSTQNILDLAYNFIQANNPDRLEVKLKIDKRLLANTNDNQGIIEVLEGTDLSSELNLVAKKILELKPNSSWNDFAILLRRNAAADELLPILTSNNIPYTFVANRGLYKKSIILDLLAYCNLLDNFHDSHSLYRVLNLPKFLIPPSELASLLAFAHKKAVSLYEAIFNASLLTEISSESKIRLKKLIELLHHHSLGAGRLNATEIFVQIVKDIGMEEKLREDTAENLENRELVEQFFKKIESFQTEEAEKSLHNLLYTLNLEMQAGDDGEIKFDPNIGPESVKVLTVHSAKGLEFKYVFVVSMVDQRFPTRDKSEGIEIPTELIKDILPEGDFHLQEERRLFYVAVTRAKTHLYLSWAPDYGGSRTKKPSLFLLETKLVPSEKINKATGKVIFSKAPLKNEPLVYVAPTQFSYSQIIDFQTCPLKYKYQHYLKLPVEGTCHLSFGQTIHKVFEEYLNLYKINLELPQQDLFGKKPEVVLPEFKFLEQLYEKCWVDDWYKDKKEKEEYRALGKKMLKTFYQGLQKNSFAPAYVEKFFRLKLGKYEFRGKMDRADRINNNLVIWDYKTGKTPKTDAKKKDLDQLYIYQWAAEEFLKEKVVGLNYWFLQDDVIIPEEIANHEQIGDLKKRLLEIIERIVYVTIHNSFKEEHKKAKSHKCEFEYLE